MAQVKHAQFLVILRDSIPLFLAYASYTAAPTVSAARRLFALVPLSPPI